MQGRQGTRPALPPARKGENVEQVGRYWHHESTPYDFVSRDTGERIAGTTHKLALLQEGRMPVIVKIPEQVALKLDALKLQPGSGLRVVYEMNTDNRGNAQPRVVDIATDKAAA